LKEPFPGRGKSTEFHSKAFTEEKNIHNFVLNYVPNTSQKIKILEFCFEPFHGREKVTKEAVAVW
jgi:hypothetical protein